MKLSIEQFAGEAPIVPDHLLPIQNASVTLNARQEGNSLVPIRGEVATHYAAPAGTVKSFAIYPFNKSVILTRNDKARFIRGAIANDAWKRVYIAGDEQPPSVVYTSGGSVLSASLGINKPSMPSIPASWETAQPSNPNSQVVRCAYIVTAVTARGEESEPSDPSIIINRWDGATIPITLGAVTDSRTASRRIYRTEGGGLYNFVAEIPVETTTYSDLVVTALLGIPCPSGDWSHPHGSLTGIISVGNGFMAGHYENTLCFSEPYQPHAWPVTYQLAFPDKIVSLASVGGIIVVATEGVPWIVSGGHPAAMSQTSLDIRASALGAHSHVDMGEFSLYPAPEGLMMATNGNIQLVTRAFFNKQQWLALQPETFKAFRYRGQYLCFGAVQHFIFNLEFGYFPIKIGAPTDEVLSAHYQADEDRLYLLIKHADNTRSIKIFDEGDNKTLEWTSREFVLHATASITCARVDAEADAVLKIIDENYNYETTVASDKGFRLPHGRPKRMKVKVSSAGRINVLTLASSMGELL